MPPVFDGGVYRFCSERTYPGEIEIPGIDRVHNLGKALQTICLHMIQKQRAQVSDTPIG